MALSRFAGADVAALVIGWPPVVAAAPVAGVVAGGAAVLDAEPELFSSFGSWMASSPAIRTSSPTRRSFLRRSALRAATRRAGHVSRECS